MMVLVILGYTIITHHRRLGVLNDCEKMFRMFSALMHNLQLLPNLPITLVRILLQASQVLDLL